MRCFQRGKEEEEEVGFGGGEYQPWLNNSKVSRKKKRPVKGGNHKNINLGFRTPREAIEEAPWVDPLPKQCRITGPCGEFVADLIVSKAMPSKKDIVCCQEIVQTSKYCWETIMDTLEDPIIPAFTNLHPWAENAWNKCVSLTDSAAPAPLSYNSPTQTATLPAQCKISEMCGNSLAQIIVAKTLPAVKDFTCCKEIVQSTKYCWDKVMEIVEDPNIPALAHLHPWAEFFWNDCVDITAEWIVPHH